MLERIFPGESELARRMRALDWSATDLGPPQSWAENLRTAVSLCLTSGIPIVLFVGPQFSVLYNDAYISFLGEGKHPRYLGQPARECWREIWHTIGPMLEGVRATGEATWSEDVQMFFARRLPLEEVYVRFTYGPILQRDGRTVDGIFTPCTETTEQVIAARRLETLRKLGVKPSETWTAPQTCKEVAAVLGANPNDIPFAAIYLADESGARAELCATARLDDRHALPSSVSLSETSVSPWPLASVLRSRRAEPVVDLGAVPESFPGGPWGDPARTALVLPIPATAHDRLAGLLVVGVSSRLVLDAAYRTFFELVAGHIGAAIAEALAYEAERRRAEALAELDRAKTAFFSNVSHEFRTPLTLMLGPVEELLSRSHRELSPSAKGQLEIVHRNGLRLLRLVNSLLDFSRIEAGRVRAVFHPTDLAAFTADLASVFRAAVERAGLRLSVDCAPLPETAYVDRDMWEKIVLNLLSNAFKFTFEGEIAVTLRAVGGAAELRVRDTGTGVPAEEIPRLFERFHRVDNARGRTHEGSGIGLALVQELVKLHGGSIGVQSALGQGTTFTVTLPLGSAHLPADRIGHDRLAPTSGAGASSFVEEALRWLPDDPSDQEPPSGARPSSEPSPSLAPPAQAGDERPLVLVADDNADMRQYIVRLLAERYRVQAVADGEIALAAAHERPPSLILTDVMMPRLDGFGLLKAIREDPTTREIPVILLSARAGEESRVEGIEAGADDYLIKPFSARELLARVSAHLQMASLRRESSQALRESEARFRAIFEQAGAGVSLVDTRTDRFEIVNQALCEMLGYTRDELRRMRWQDITHPDDLRADQELARCVLAREIDSYTMEKRYVRKDGSALWCHLYGTCIWRDGAPAYGVGVMMDITSRKLAEEALRRSEEALTRQRQQLEEADRRKDEFLATLAHELRNPLAPIKNSLHLLRLTGGAAPPRVHEMLDRQMSHMVRLVDDLLEISRITRGKIALRKERVDLSAVVRGAVEESRGLIEAARHQLTVRLPSEPVVLWADPVRLTQVLANLLNNAAKYTEDGGHIWLTARSEASTAVLSVRDSGVGIPSAMLPKVFDMFTQVERSYGRAQGGLGIGLTLARSVVEMHGGSIQAESSGPGHGSEFIVRLPLIADSVGPKDSDLPVGEQTSSLARRVLVVDDNRDAAESLGMLLDALGAETHVVHDGPAALEAIRTHRPSVVLLDIGMPGMDGYEVARRARKQQGGEDLTLIALTGWGQEEDRRRSREAGFDHHLVKPVDTGALQALIAPSGEAAPRADRAGGAP